MTDQAKRAGHPGFLAVLDEVRQLHCRKSLDYGTEKDALQNIRDSADVVNMPPWAGAILRVCDKLHRIKAFFSRGRVEFDGVEDTLLDGCAYFAIALALYRESRGVPPAPVAVGPVVDVPPRPDCTQSRRTVMVPVGFGEPADELRKRGYTQSQAEPWKWFAPLNATPTPPPDVAAIRERARRWSGPYTPTYHALAADVEALANALEQATAAASGGNGQASTAEK